MMNTVRKREGQLVEFDRKKIVEAIFAAMQVMGEENKSRSEKITDQVIKNLEEIFKGSSASFTKAWTIFFLSQ